MNENILSVRQLNLYVRSLMESDVKLNNITVKGELSNFQNHYASGHWYFTLKDRDASIRCVMFKTNASRVRFDAKNGLEVVLRGRVSLYEKDGQYQFYCEEMNAFGIGDIALKFEQVKQKLLSEGLFDSDSKRALPKFPKRIAVITSPTGAAVRDIINILSRRWPICEILLCPVSVQGENAVPEMLVALDRVYALSGIDLIIIGRGGGSIEDLWAFNDEKLARKIYEAPIPVISAVGHETDFTISDFVADLRAPTPSAAAELAVPDIKEALDYLNKRKDSLKYLLGSKLETNIAKFNSLNESLFLKKPIDLIIERKSEYIDRLQEKLTGLINNRISGFENDFIKNVTALDNLSPLKTLSRGFTAVKKNDELVKSVKNINIDDNLSLYFSDGNAICKVIEKNIK